MKGNIFILKKEVNWSMLNDGFNIGLDERGLFKLYMKDILTHGKIEGEEYQASLVNINFNQDRWGNHKDLIQIRYSSKSPIARKL